jgi:hypothetical protein
VIAWVISEAIPVFNTLLSLIVSCLFSHMSLMLITSPPQTSLFASWFTCM